MNFLSQTGFILALVVTGAVFFFDLIVLSRQRKEKLLAVEKQFARFKTQTEPGLDADSKVQLEYQLAKAAYKTARAAAATQPEIVGFGKISFVLLVLLFIWRTYIPFSLANINLPLILTVAVAVTGLVWLLDAFVLARPRAQKIAVVDKQFTFFKAQTEPAANADNKTKEDYKVAQTAYESAQQTAAQEPLLVEYSKSFFPVLLVVFVLRSFIAEPFQIPSGSMEPTLDVGDFILVNKYTYGIRLPVLNKKIIEVNQPQRGDVMVFFPPHMPDTYFIKRVIGLPGDEIKYLNHVLYINGAVVEESLLAQLPVGNPSYRQVTETIGDKTFTANKSLVPGELSGAPHRYYAGVWRVPAGHYFMMGDNRDHSADSRVWGMVSEDAIVGKAFAVWMHWKDFKSIPSFGKAGVIE